MQYTLFVVLAPLAAVCSIGTAAYAWRHRAAPGAAVLAWHLIAISAWLLTYVFELLTQTESVTLFWDKLCYVPVVIVPVTGLAFALEYTGRPRWATFPRLLLFFIVPAITVLLVQTNELHHLIWRSYTFIRVGPFLTQKVTGYGPGFWAYVPYAYTLTTISMLLIVTAYFKSFRIYRQQTNWVLMGAFMPLIANIIYVFRLIPGLQQDYSPVTFALGGLFFAVGIFRFRLFDLKPIARNVLVDNMSDGMIVLDESQRIVDVNPAGQKMVGLPADSLIGQPATSALKSWGFLAEKLSSQQESQSDISLIEGGNHRHYELHISPLRSRHGRLMGHLVTLHDFTERQRLIHELDAYAHTVAHDLKSPLSALLGYAEMLRDIPDHQLDSDMREGLRQISQASQKMVTIVDGLLLLASARQNRKVASEPLNMASIISELRSRSAALVEDAQAEIVAPEKWPMAVGYAPWVEEIWANYVGNAIKYGGQPPRIELGADSQPGGMIRFWVRDNGAGLAPEQVAQLFIPFTRLPQARAAGHGLGLSIVQRITERMGGTVGVESQPGQGSLFFFTLPEATTQEE